jgi:hypothetical protein
MFTLELARAHINDLQREAARDSEAGATRAPNRLLRFVARHRSGR